MGYIKAIYPLKYGVSKKKRGLVESSRRQSPDRNRSRKTRSRLRRM